jgi:hypothetical protein
VVYFSVAFFWLEKYGNKKHAAFWLQKILFGTSIEGKYCNK